MEHATFLCQSPILQPFAAINSQQRNTGWSSCYVCPTRDDSHCWFPVTSIRSKRTKKHGHTKCTHLGAKALCETDQDSQVLRRSNCPPNIDINVVPAEIAHGKVCVNNPLPVNLLILLLLTTHRVCHVLGAHCHRTYVLRLQISLHIHSTPTQLVVHVQVASVFAKQ